MEGMLKHQTQNDETMQNPREEQKDDNEMESSIPISLTRPTKPQPAVPWMLVSFTAPDTELVHSFNIKCLSCTQVTCAMCEQIMLVPPLLARSTFKCCACPTSFMVEPHLGFSSNNLDLVNKPINMFESTPLLDFNNFLFYYGHIYSGKQLVCGYFFKRDQRLNRSPPHQADTPSSFLKGISKNIEGSISKKWKPVLTTFDGDTLRFYHIELRLANKEKKYKLLDEIPFRKVKVLSFENYGEKKHIIELTFSSGVIFLQAASTLMSTWWETAFFNSGHTINKKNERDSKSRVVISAIWQHIKSEPSLTSSSPLSRKTSVLSKSTQDPSPLEIDLLKIGLKKTKSISEISYLDSTSERGPSIQQKTEKEDSRRIQETENAYKNLSYLDRGLLDELEETELEKPPSLLESEPSSSREGEDNALSLEKDFDQANNNSEDGKHSEERANLKKQSEQDEDEDEFSIPIALNHSPKDQLYFEGKDFDTSVAEELMAKQHIVQEKYEEETETESEDPFDSLLDMLKLCYPGYKLENYQAPQSLSVIPLEEEQPS